MNHLSDIGIVKYRPWAFQNRVDHYHNTFRSKYSSIRSSKWFYWKITAKKSDFLKNRPIFSISLKVWILSFRRLIGTIWVLNSLYFQWYPDLPSLTYWGVSGSHETPKTQEKSRFMEYSLKYLSDHLSNVLKSQNRHPQLSNALSPIDLSLKLAKIQYFKVR